MRRLVKMFATDGKEGKLVNMNEISIANYVFLHHLPNRL